LPFLTTFPRKLLFFRTFSSIKSRGSYLISRTVNWHGCPVVVPQAYIWYKRLSLKQGFFESRTRAYQEPTWKASATLRADHRRRLIPRGTPEARVATELSVRARTLQERYPGARVRAPRQKGAQIERWPRPRRMDNGALADANKAEAATTNKLELASQS
jgi:hypothetical protein